LTAKGLDTVLGSLVNNTGEIRAQTIGSSEGKIYLLGDMDNGTVKVDGVLDARAPNGGNGGFVETSAAHVKVADTARVTTLAANGQAGTWLIDPNDFTVASSGGDMTGAAVGTALAGGNFTIQSSQGATSGNGDIFVNDNITWTSGTTLTLSSARNIKINATIDASGGSGGVMTLNYGQGAVAASNTATYDFGLTSAGFTGKLNLKNGQNFITKLGSNGSSVTYTVINSAAAFQNINNTLSGNFALGSSVDLTGVTWTPIGSYPSNANVFTGKFDGLGHVVDHLTINNNSSGLTQNVGLFGYVNIAADGIKNIGVTNANITVNGGGNGVGHIGVLAGIVRGGVINSYATGSISVTSTIANINVKAGIGGLIGEMNVNGSAGTAVTSNSFANVAINATGSGSLFKSVGGLSDIWKVPSLIAMRLVLFPRIKT